VQHSGTDGQRRLLAWHRLPAETPRGLGAANGVLRAILHMYIHRVSFAGAHRTRWVMDVVGGSHNPDSI